MSVSLNVNGSVFTFPQKGESPNSSPAVDWGNTVTNWAVAVTAGMLQKAGGAFTLTAEVDFGASYGLKSLYYKTRTANIATAGQFRLARADVISFRNEANNANLDLAVNASNQLTFNGSVLAVGTGDVAGPGSSTDNAVARFDLTTGKLIQDTPNCTIADSGEITSNSLTASTALVSSSGKRIQSSVTTLAELAYLSGTLGPVQVKADDLRIALEFDTTDLAAASTTDAFAKIINQGAIINALSLSTADVAVGHFDSTNKKFGTYSYACGSGRVLAFPGRSGPKYTGSLSAWYRNLTAGDYIAFNRLLGVEVYLDGSGNQTTRLTERTASGDSTKTTNTVVGGSNRALDPVFRNVTTKWRCNDAAGASTDLLEMEREGSDEGSQLTGQDLDINPGDGGNWIFGAKKNDPASWDHFYAANTVPSSHASPWTYTSAGSPTAPSVSNGVLTITTDTTTQTSYYSKTGATTLAGVNLANQTVEVKMRVTAAAQRLSVPASRMAALYIHDGSMLRGFQIQWYKGSVLLREASSNTVAFECQIDTSQFHIYRLTTTGATNPIPSFYIDDVCVFVGSANSTSDAGANDYIEFGDNDATSTINSTTEWEWVAYADEIAAPTAGNATGNVDSVGVVLGNFSDAVITALQSSKISDIYRNLPNYGPTLPRTALGGRNGNQTTSNGTFAAVDNGLISYVMGDGVTQYEFGAGIDLAASAVPTSAYLAVDVDSDFIGLGNAIPYGGAPCDLTSTTQGFMLQVTRQIVLTPGLHTVRPVWMRASGAGTLSTSENFWRWEAKITKTEKLQ